MKSDVPPPIDRVLTRCLSCYAAFPANDVLETLRAGACIAFDPARWNPGADPGIFRG